MPVKMPPIHCPFKKSEMTPCVLTDGDICWALDSKNQPLCVGCEKRPTELFNYIRERTSDDVTIKGIDR